MYIYIYIYICAATACLLSGEELGGLTCSGSHKSYAQRSLVSFVKSLELLCFRIQSAPNYNKLIIFYFISVKASTVRSYLAPCRATLTISYVLQVVAG